LILHPRANKEGHHLVMKPPPLQLVRPLVTP
jgi:hypothetical protein